MKVAKLVFFGNEKLATGISVNISVKQALINNGYKIHSVDKDLEDKEEELHSLKPDIGVLVAYGRILPKTVIDIFPYGIINIHPSLLPQGRGPTPIEEIILSGKNKTGVSIMQVAEGMDEGPIIAQQAIDLTGTETKQELADRLLTLGCRLLIKCLDDILSGKAKPLPQSENEASYTKKISKEDGIIAWDKPAILIEREIRAYAGWPKSKAKINDVDCIILDADVLEAESKPGEIKTDKNTLIVGCGKNSLTIQRLQPSGKKPMTAGEFIRGYIK